MAELIAAQEAITSGTKEIRNRSEFSRTMLRSDTMTHYSRRKFPRNEKSTRQSSDRSGAFVQHTPMAAVKGVPLNRSSRLGRINLVASYNTRVSMTIPLVVPLVSCVPPGRGGRCHDERHGGHRPPPITTGPGGPRKQHRLYWECDRLVHLVTPSLPQVVTAWKIWLRPLAASCPSCLCVTPVCPRTRLR